MKRINFLSGGIASWACGKMVARQHGTDSLINLFADTNYEDADLYRFLPEAASNIGGELVRIAEGRTPWQVFHDERVIGNTRTAPCSRTLKQRLCRKWLEANCDPASTVLYVGIAYYERHRMEDTKDRIGIRTRWLPWRVEAPLCEPPCLERYEMRAWLEREGIDLPAMYDEGFPSNNCGGRCVKQGHDGWRRLLLKRRESFLEAEREEESMRAYLGKDVAILRDRRGGTTKPLPLVEFRRRIESGQGCELLDSGKPCECLFGEGDDDAGSGDGQSDSRQPGNE